MLWIYSLKYGKWPSYRLLCEVQAEGCGYEKPATGDNASQRRRHQTGNEGFVPNLRHGHVQNFTEKVNCGNTKNLSPPHIYMWGVDILLHNFFICHNISIVF